MKYQIIDDCISKENLITLQSIILGGDFPWYFTPYKVYKNKTTHDSYDFQFTHMVYFNHRVRTHIPEIFEPLLEKINPAAIVKIKANLTTLTQELIIYDMHVDVNDYDFYGKTSVFYMNTNNGYTLFEDGTKIESVANRLLTFDANLKHTGTSCTDEKFRCVLNINYFPK
jgi:hypothetical protein